VAARITLPNGWRPRGYQLPAWSYLENGGRHAELVWHRRSGKDEVALHRTACAAFERQANYWHMLPEYAQARKAIWDAVNPHTGRKRIDEAFPLELRKTTRNQEMLIEFCNGSTWQVVGSDAFNSLVGSAPAGIVYSEWALSNPAARAYLRPILAENNGWQVFITTPRGRNHAHTTLKAAEKLMRAGQDAFAQILSANDTGALSPEKLAVELAAYIADFGEDYGRAKFEQEYLCSFDAANLGAILARQIGIAEKEGRVSDDVEFDPYGAPIEISADIGRRDTATWYFWQPLVGGFAVFDYDGGFGIDAEEWCDRLAAKLGQYRLEGRHTPLGKIWLPHDARAKTFAAKHSTIEIFAKKFGADRVAITPEVKRADRINAARTVVRRVKFNATRCEPGLDGLRAWSYEWDETRKQFSSEPKHDWASHDGDGFSYGCVVMQQAAPPSPPPQAARGVAVGVPAVSLDEMWASTPKPSGRI
jgi:phage terminase large subunit